MKVRCVTKDFVVLESSGRKAGSIFFVPMVSRFVPSSMIVRKKERMADL